MCVCVFSRMETGRARPSRARLKIQGLTDLSPSSSSETTALALWLISLFLFAFCLCIDVPSVCGCVAGASMMLNKNISKRKERWTERGSRRRGNETSVSRDDVIQCEGIWGRDRRESAVIRSCCVLKRVLVHVRFTALHGGKRERKQRGSREEAGSQRVNVGTCCTLC